MMKSRKVRVIEGVEPEEFQLDTQKSEFFFIEISKSGESESLLGLDDWLFLGKRKGYPVSASKSGKNECSEITKFFEKIQKKEVLP